MDGWPGGSPTPHRECRQRCPGHPGRGGFDLSSSKKCRAADEISAAGMKSIFPGPVPLCRRGCRDDPAVLHMYDAIAVGRGFGVVRDHEDGLAQPPVQVP
jgi:hypothetical protein